MRLIFIGLVAICLAEAFVSHARGEDQQIQKTDNGEVRSSFALPKVFDFDYYKREFGKSYTSFAEELVRRKIYLGRALRSYISGVAYKFRRANYYLATNTRSDWTPAELLKLEETFYIKSNGKVEYDPKRVNATEVNELLLEQEPILDIEDVEQEFERLKAHEDIDPNTKIILKELGLDKQINEHLRRKRSMMDESPREFSLDQLIDRQVRNEANLRRPQKRVKSNNPNYEPPELVSMGWSRPRLNLGIKWDRMVEKIGSIGQEKYGIIGHMEEFEAGAKVDKSDKSSSGNDQIYFSHLPGGCFNEIQDQRLCGSSYAFAATAYFEWLLCKKTGELVKFSEQYVVDCGPSTKLRQYLKGCQGGSFFKMGAFYEEYGAELAQNYPYTSFDGQCPYAMEEKNLNQVGYLRFEPGIRKGVAITIKKWPEYLKIAPLVVNIGTRGDFHEYGGGVSPGKDCCKGLDADDCGRLSVLVVGHGKQDGEEYWLMRLAFAVTFGEQGYYKLRKKSDCIHPEKGFMFGTQKGKSVSMRLKKSSRRVQK